MSEVEILSSEQLRQLQMNTLELVVEVDRICRKYNIQYSLDGGTLLGAVRHKGFIPWDDDADVIFTRHEYAKFRRACKKELKKDRFFLQDYKTDPNYRWGYAKMRNLGTEFIRSGQEHMKYKTGVFIDVFVVDNVPDNKASRFFLYYLNVALRKILYSELGQVAAKQGWLRKWYSYLYKIPKNSVFRVRNFFARICNKKKTELVSHWLFPYPRKNCKYGMPSICFSEYTELEFEGMKFKAFKDYDLYLSILYGEYMKLPPKEKQYGINTASTIRTDIITLSEIQDRYNRENK